MGVAQPTIYRPVFLYFSQKSNFPHELGKYYNVGVQTRPVGLRKKLKIAWSLFAQTLNPYHVFVLWKWDILNFPPRHFFGTGSAPAELVIFLNLDICFMLWFSV